MAHRLDMGATLRVRKADRRHDRRPTRPWLATAPTWGNTVNVEAMHWRSEWPTMVHDRLFAAVELPGVPRICRRDPASKAWRWYRADRVARSLDHATDLVIGLHLAWVIEVDAHEDCERRIAQPLPRAVSDLDAVERARRYVARIDPSVAGQRGAGVFFRVACALMRGFALSVDDAMPIIAEYDARSDPEWGKKEQRRALISALRRGRMAVGSLLGRQQRRTA